MNEFLVSSPLTIPVVACFVAGTVIAQQFPSLPQPSSLAAMAVVGVALAGLRPTRLPAVILIGMVWALSFAALRLSEGTFFESETRDWVLRGVVSSVPVLAEEGARFDFAVDRESAATEIPGRIRLSWYRTHLSPRALERWQLCVRLRRPHGYLNPGGFDYERWLFSEGIGALGYVRDCEQNVRMGQTGGPWSPSLWRQHLQDRLRAALAESEFSGIIQALVMGADDDISPEQWEVFRRTGTTHLVAISGSHISLIAGIAFFLTRRTCARFGLLRWSPQRLAAIVAFLAALGYAALADFAIPTRRALIMITVVMGGAYVQRRLRPWHTLSLALFAVTLADPLAVLSAGFWLSFAAVAVILLTLSHRLRAPTWWKGLWNINWATSLGLAPLLILFFQQVSLISPLANLLAVPALGMVAIPLCLSGSILLMMQETLGLWFLGLIDSYIHWVWAGLKLLSVLPFAQWHHPPPSPWAFTCAAAGMMMMLLPRGIPGRGLTWMLLLPFLSEQPERPVEGAFRLSLLDVGQALSAVVQTRNQFLVFDTGARLSRRFDTGAAVVEPFLRNQGARRIDVLVVSHGDNDHIGGVHSLRKAFEIGRIYTSVPEQLSDASPLACSAGQTWETDGVRFEVLSPAGRTGNDNDLSCVLKVSGTGGCALLTGDIEQTAEAELVSRYGARLNCQVLIAPHHGSKSSSSGSFVEAVHPRYVLIPAGYMNRYGFPHPAVLKRYGEIPSQAFNTATDGAISVEISQGGVSTPRSWRKESARYWNAAPGEGAH